MALKLLSEVLAQFGLSATTAELTSTVRMQLEMDSRMTKAIKASKDLILSAKVLA